MKVCGRVLAVVALVLLGSCGDGSRQSGPKGIGEVDVVVRVVRGTLVNYNQARLLAVSDPVYWREQIDTETGSATQMEFADGTRLTVGPEARVVLDEFVYGGPPGTDRMVLTVTKGISRFITGDMDKAAYEIRAPGAIIGVRGTDFTLMVDPARGVTTCLVHHGEVTFRRSEGGPPVVIKPGEASKVVARDPSPLPPPSAPPPEVMQEADQLQTVIRKAQQSHQEQLLREASVPSQPEASDRRLTALQTLQPPRAGGDRLSILADQVRSVAGESRAPGGPARDDVSSAAAAAARLATAHPQVSPKAQAPAPAAPSASVVAKSVAPSAVPPPAETIGGVPLPSPRGPCEGASCLAEPPPNRVISPTRL